MPSIAALNGSNGGATRTGALRRGGIALASACRRSARRPVPKLMVWHRVLGCPLGTEGSDRARDDEQRGHQGSRRLEPIRIFARLVSGIVSVGLNSLELVNDMYR